MSNDAQQVVVPRPAATVLIVRDDPFEVLLMLRSPGNDFFPDSYVFPGGRVEDHDRDPSWSTLVEHGPDVEEHERAFRIAAVRETHEEAALFIADGFSGTPPQPVPSALEFLELVRNLGARLLLDEIVPYAHWITPPGGPKRFDTHFYITRAPGGQLAKADATENNEARWINPAEAVDLAQQGALALPPPTFMNLMMLSQSADSEQALWEARRHTVVPLNPIVKPTGEGSFRLTVPLEAGYGKTDWDFPEMALRAESRPPRSS